MVCEQTPGITEAELAEAMFGDRNQPRVHQEIDVLENQGLVRRDRTETPMRLYAIVRK